MNTSPQIDPQTTFERLKDGRIQVTKDGQVGVGKTLAEASHDLANKLTLYYFENNQHTST